SGEMGRPMAVALTHFQLVAFEGINGRVVHPTHHATRTTRHTAHARPYAGHTPDATRTHAGAHAARHTDTPGSATAPLARSVDFFEVEVEVERTGLLLRDKFDVTHEPASRLPEGDPLVADGPA